MNKTNLYKQKKNLVKLQNFIDGEFCTPLNKKYIENINPATSEILSFVPDSTKEDVELAVAASQEAIQRGWGQNSINERIEFCKKIANKIKEKLPSLALAECRDTGLFIYFIFYILYP